MRLSRRTVLIGGLTFAVAACSAERVHADPPAEPLPPLDQQIGALERRHNAVVGLSAVNLNSPPGTVAHRPDQMFAMCSTFKAYAAGRVLEQVGRGELSLEATEFVDPSAVVANSPVTGPRAAVR